MFLEKREKALPQRALSKNTECTEKERPRKGHLPLDAKLVQLAHGAAEAEGLDTALVCAVVEQESGWNPWAMRYEPAFFAKYVAPLYTNNVVVAVLAARVLLAWRDARLQQAGLQTELKTTQQALAEATERQASRDVIVNDLVSWLRKKQTAVQKPAQVVAALADILTLPVPITIESGTAPTQKEPGAPDGPPETILPKVNFPAADLKPLYDFAVDCKACQAKLGAAQADLADEKVKTQMLGRERDDALRIARGGGTWRLIGRAAKWFLIGVATGAIAAKATH